MRGRKLPSMTQSGWGSPVITVIIIKTINYLVVAGAGSTVITAYFMDFSLEIRNDSALTSLSRSYSLHLQSYSHSINQLEILR